MFGRSAQLEKTNEFYRDHYQKLIYVLIILIVVLLVVVSFVLYQVFHRPLPQFYAVSDSKQQLKLTPFNEPNLLPETILRWASKATVAAYTFDFVNYNKQISAARFYFTDAGWNDFVRSISPVVQTISRNQLFVNGVVSGPPVIVNQGNLEGKGYIWRIQLPFLVTYQSAETVQRQNYTVILTIMKIPTYLNPKGIGIDQFIMVANG